MKVSDELIADRSNQSLTSRYSLTSGVKPFATNDEWYFHMRFKDSAGVTPTMRRNGVGTAQ